jgi:hypothetical protein
MIAADDCVHEARIVATVLDGAWPHRADRELIAHATECATCREVAGLAEAIHDDHERARYEVRVPAAGQVWWRSAIRARLESTHAATRPMTWLHGITGAIAVGLLLALCSAAWPMLGPLAAHAWAAVVPLFPSADVAAALAGGLRLSLMLGLAVAAIILLAPLALYFALSDD